MADSIDPVLLKQCRSMLPMLLTDSKYVDSGVTFHELFKVKPDRFPAIAIDKIDKNDLFIIANPCLDYASFKNIITCEVLWRFAAKCLCCAIDGIAFSFMNITRKPAIYGPSIHWHRDFGNKMTSTLCSQNMLRIIVPLDDCGTESGGLEVVSKSHYIADNLVLGGNDIDIDDCFSRAEITHLKPGDMLALNSKLIHGGRINSSDVDRNNLVFQFIRKGATHITEDINEPYHNLGLAEIRTIA